MYVRPITYEDLDGNTRTEEYCFNLNKAELTEMHLTATGGLDNVVRKIIATQDNAGLVNIFKKLILDSYGEKSLDGKHFLKEDEDGRPLSRKFKQSEAYAALFMELSSDENKAIEFITNIMPKDLRDKAVEASKDFKNSLPTVTPAEN